MKIRTNLKSGDACYSVQSGDSLSAISQKFYGDQSADNVARIYYSNQATIGPNPNLISPGQKLYIPS
ncbi:MAG: LysM peptidoglycan-binding domain-containing protein [Anaerolineales bacterium]